MSPEKQRIKIAEACGWKDMFIENNRPLLGRHEPESMGRDYLCVPDYLNDLNAMHEAEKMLFPTHEAKWAMTMSEVCGHSWRIIYTATAAQRAEAFLKTLSLWTEK